MAEDKDTKDSPLRMTDGYIEVIDDGSMSLEEYFNTQCETIAVGLHRAGLEYDHNGNLVKFDTPYAMGVGAKNGEDIIAKQLK